MRISPTITGVTILLLSIGIAFVNVRNAEAQVQAQSAAAPQDQNHESQHAKTAEMAPTWTDQTPGEVSKVSGLAYFYPKGVGKVHHPLAYKPMGKLIFEATVHDVLVGTQSPKYTVWLDVDRLEWFYIAYETNSFSYKRGAKIRIEVQLWELQIIACGGVRPAEDAPLLYQIVSIEPIS